MPIDDNIVFACAYGAKPWNYSNNAPKRAYKFYPYQKTPLEDADLAATRLMLSSGVQIHELMAGKLQKPPRPCDTKRWRWKSKTLYMDLVLSIQPEQTGSHCISR